jgi:hypothetical protein
MSILARSTAAPSASWPSRISRKRARFSAGLRLRKGLSTPGLPKSPRLARISRRLLVHIGVAGFDQVFGRAVHEVEVVRWRSTGGFRLAVEVGVPVEAQPLHRVEDGVDVLLSSFSGLVSSKRMWQTPP